MTISLAQQLTERLNRNLTEFTAALVGLDKAGVVRAARTITAVEDAYRYLTTKFDFDDTEAEFLLKFKNPLLVIADKWAEDQLAGDGDDFCGMMYDFFDDENLSNFSRMPEPDEDYKDEGEDAQSADKTLNDLLNTLIEASETLLFVMADRHFNKK